MPTRLLEKMWGEAVAFLDRSRRVGWVEPLVLVGFASLIFAAIDVEHEWAAPYRAAVAIDLSPWKLPQYALYSLSRGGIAYLLSLAFSLVYGYWAAKDRIARRVLLPLLDILQSIPVLGFMPGLVLVLVAAFPASNVGLELAAMLMIFTGQAWNMTFSFYHSVRSVPQEFQEVGTVFRSSWWQRFKWVELPYATVGLVWNSMMSMAGGWFFLMVSEAFVLGDRSFQLPGIGSYMSVAAERGDAGAMVWAVVAMTAMIVVLDQLVWRPAVVWSQKFRVEDFAGGEVGSSWFLDWLRRSRLLGWLRRRAAHVAERPLAPLPRTPAATAIARGGRPLARVASGVVFVALLAGLALGAWRLAHLLVHVPPAAWAVTVGAALVTLGRVLGATVLGTLWAVPAGIAIGLSPRLARALQPVAQVAASFPAPMLFPAVIAGLGLAHVPLGWGSVLLMLLGTQWYILFNVIAGATGVPSDLREAAREYRLGRWLRLTRVYLPAVFPYLVTGWVTAAGGAWNASIVAEYVSYHGHVVTAFGLGSRISQAAERADFPALAAGVLVMAALVVLFNRAVWRRCYRLAEDRYSMSR
jgi:NitT/TauT family transport system permease protein